MQDLFWGRRAGTALLLGTLASLAIAACGGGSGPTSTTDAAALLQETFGGSHVVSSGYLRFTVTVMPTGSRTLTGPITLSFGGPFESLGEGQLPKSNFNVSIRALGKTGSLAILSTGTTGDVTVQGTSYELPDATFQQLEGSFAQIASSPSSSSDQGTLAGLGIDPMRWLIDPTIVGKQTVGGADTTHIRAGINVQALLQDVNTFLERASALGASGAARIPSGISVASRTRIAGEVKNPSFDVWTGVSDKTIRRIAIKLTLPVSGRISTELGGLSSAGLGVDIEYADLNKPQRIEAPATVRPFGEFSAKLQSALATIQSTATGESAATSSGASGGSTASTGVPRTAITLRDYARCLQTAGQDISKMERCAKILNK